MSEPQPTGKLRWVIRGYYKDKVLQQQMYCEYGTYWEDVPIEEEE